MSEDCPKCIYGWIHLDENHYEMCDCPLGQAMRDPQRVLLIYTQRRVEVDPAEQAFEWYKRKMGRVT